MSLDEAFDIYTEDMQPGDVTRGYIRVDNDTRRLLWAKGMNDNAPAFSRATGRHYTPIHASVDVIASCCLAMYNVALQTKRDPSVLGRLTYSRELAVTRNEILSPRNWLVTLNVCCNVTGIDAFQIFEDSVYWTRVVVPMYHELFPHIHP